MPTPYSLQFGRKPPQYIHRETEEKQIIESFNSDLQHIFMITGLRASGKTVLMTYIKAQLSSSDTWITIELNPERDMLKTLASKLSSEDHPARIFQNAKINLSFFGFGLEANNPEILSKVSL